MNLHKEYNISLLPNLAEGFFSTSVPRWDTCGIKITEFDVLELQEKQINCPTVGHLQYQNNSV